MTYIFCFIISMRTIPLITEKELAEIYKTNFTEGDIMGATAHVQIMFPLNDKNKGYMYFNTFFLGCTSG